MRYFTCNPRMPYLEKKWYDALFVGEDGKQNMCWNPDAGWSLASGYLPDLLAKVESGKLVELSYEEAETVLSGVYEEVARVLGCRCEVQRVDPDGRS